MDADSAAGGDPYGEQAEDGHGEHDAGEYDGVAVCRLVNDLREQLAGAFLKRRVLL